MVGGSLLGIMSASIQPRVESNPHSVHLRIYLDHEVDGHTRKSDNYDAECVLDLYGPRGIIWGVHGDGFYLALWALVKEAEQYGVSTLSGYVRPSHLRLLKREAEKLGLTVDAGPVEEAYGREMHWITLHL